VVRHLRGAVKATCSLAALFFLFYTALAQQSPEVGYIVVLPSGNSVLRLRLEKKIEIGQISEEIISKIHLIDRERLAISLRRDGRVLLFKFTSNNNFLITMTPDSLTDVISNSIISLEDSGFYAYNSFDQSLQRFNYAGKRLIREHIPLFEAVTNFCHSKDAIHLALSSPLRDSYIISYSLKSKTFFSETGSKSDGHMLLSRFLNSGGLTCSSDAVYYALNDQPVVSIITPDLRSGKDPVINRKDCSFQNLISEEYWNLKSVNASNILRPPTRNNGIYSNSDGAHYLFIDQQNIDVKGRSFLLAMAYDDCSNAQVFSATPSQRDLLGFSLRDIRWNRFVFFYYGAQNSKENEVRIWTIVE